MGLHSAMWRVHISEIDDMTLIMKSIEWIAGENASIKIDKGKSIHGAIQNTIIANVDNKKNAYESFFRLGKQTLSQIMKENISKRIDGNKNFHIRLDISSLVSEEISINENRGDLIAKGIFKIECYPGNTPENIISELIKKYIDEGNI